MKIEGSIERFFYTGKVGNITSGERTTLGKCSSCSLVMTAQARLSEYTKKRNAKPVIRWGNAERVWPDVQTTLSKIIPSSIRDSLVEATRCLEHGAYTASVAMTGRALEAVARHFHKGGKEKHLMLGKGLEELHANKIIDERLYLWSKELHEHRNLAAHATDALFTKDDAGDLFDFAVAICEYVFVVSKKYETFVGRKESRKEIKKFIEQAPSLETRIK
jgi:hypothetical protein